MLNISWPPASSCSWCSYMVNGTGKARSCPSVFLPTIACFPVPVWQLCSTIVQLLASVSSCPIYLQRITGLNARDTGLVLLLQPVLMALLSPVTGALSDRINPAVLASSGMILITFGLSCLAINVSLCLSFFLLAHCPGPGHHRHRFCPVHGAE